MTRRSSACASSTRACISSRLKAPSCGPWPGRELAPPVVAHLITSAPARTIAPHDRTHIGEVSTTPLGSAGVRQQQESPDGLTGSPMPPIGDMIEIDRTRRGPGSAPRRSPAGTRHRARRVADRRVAGGERLGAAPRRCAGGGCWAARRSPSAGPGRSRAWPGDRGSRSAPAARSSRRSRDFGIGRRLAWLRVVTASIRPRTTTSRPSPGRRRCRRSASRPSAPASSPSHSFPEH